MTESLREVRLPSQLCEAAEQRFAAHFGSLEELLVFVLRNLISDDVAQMDQAEQRLIEERLRDLGYI